MSRTIYFFPLFLVGYKLTPRFFAESKPFAAPAMASIAILLINLVGFYLLRSMPPQWVFGSMPYSVMGATGPWAAAARLLLYVVSFVSIIAMLVMMPRRESLLTTGGRGSLVTYLVHGLVVKTLIFVGVIDVLAAWPAAGILAICGAIATLLVVLLSSRSVQVPVRWALDATARALIQASRPKPDRGESS